jgi:hypothetical protein
MNITELEATLLQTPYFINSYSKRNIAGGRMVIMCGNFRCFAGYLTTLYEV